MNRLKDRKGVFWSVVIVVLLSGYMVLETTQAGPQLLKSLDARYIPPGDSAEGPTFILSSSDHDVELSEIDFSKISFIQLDKGRPIAANSWKLLQSGHHLQGKLYFPPVATADAKQVKLTIKPIDKEDGRIFEWP